MGQYYRFINLSTMEVNEQNIDFGGCNYTQPRGLHLYKEENLWELFELVSEVKSWNFKDVGAIGDFGTLIEFNPDLELQINQVNCTAYAYGWVSKVWDDDC